MKLFSEHTEWSTAAPNHWYLLNGGRTKMFGYRKFGQGPVVLFRTPLSFDDRGRVLKLEHDFGNVQKRDVVLVTGSKGDQYEVEFADDTIKCSCHAFKFRGNCKHTEIAKQQRSH